LEVLNLTKVYSRLRGPGLRAVDGVSLRVEPGMVFGLLGPNGAGKSTLVKMLVAVVRPTGGEARLFGRPAREAAARRRVGYLPEQMRLPDFLTARKFLALMARLSGVPADRRFGLH
jgi:ABC-2 type transport system ATP-binding protein